MADSIEVLVGRLEERLKNIDKQMNDIATQIKEVKEDLQSSKEDRNRQLEELKREMKNNFVSKEEVKIPHKMVYGTAGVILISFVTAIAKFFMGGA